MATGAFAMEPRKKTMHLGDPDARDGMSASTKRHFDHVKRKMLAFVDRQHRRKKADRGMQLPPPAPTHAKPSPGFADQSRAPKQPMRHATPLLLHKQQAMFPGHLGHQKQLAHHAFATPQMPRRLGKGGMHMDGQLHPNVAFF